MTIKLFLYSWSLEKAKNKFIKQNPWIKWYLSNSNMVKSENLFLSNLDFIRIFWFEDYLKKLLTGFNPDTLFTDLRPGVLSSFFSLVVRVWTIIQTREFLDLTDQRFILNKIWRVCPVQACLVRRVRYSVLITTFILLLMVVLSLHVVVVLLAVVDNHGFSIL